MNGVGERGRPTLAVVGATGAVGGVLLDLVDQRADVWGAVRLLASDDEAGRVLPVRGEDVEVQPLTERALAGADVAVFCVPAEVSRVWAPAAVDAGVVVVDNSGVFTGSDGVPLVVEGFNGAQIHNRPRGIISSPTCSTLLMLDAIGALHSGWGLTELVVTTFHSASGVGRAGVERLYDETAAVAGDRTLGRHIGDVRRHVDGQLSSPSPFPAPLALNVVPWVGGEADDGWSSAEASIRGELRMLLDRPGLPVSATCVQVPVVAAHAMSVHAEFEGEVTLEEARRALHQAPSVVVLDDVEHDEWPTPVDVTGSDPTFVGRMRQRQGDATSIDFFVCGDNLRKGAATNTVKIAERVCGVDGSGVTRAGALR